MLNFAALGRCFRHFDHLINANVKCSATMVRMFLKNKINSKDACLDKSSDTNACKEQKKQNGLPIGGEI